jgi:four helix bundle protein
MSPPGDRRLPAAATYDMGTFEDLRAFQRALDLMVAVYAATSTFPKHELYGLTSQLRRATCSVVSQIAEGLGRLTMGERRQMLSQARGSLFEVEAQLLASRRLEFIDTASAEHLRNLTRLTGRALSGLIAWVRRREDAIRREKKRDD